MRGQRSDRGKEPRRRGLYIALVDLGLDALVGVQNKIQGQCDAFRRQGIEFDILHLRRSRLFMNEHAIRSRVRRRYILLHVVRISLREHYDVLYLRHTMTDWVCLFLVLWFRITGVRVVLEVPTYPYDREHRLGTGIDRRAVLQDRAFRLFFPLLLRKIVTSSPCERVLGCRAVNVTNGIDLCRVRLKRNRDNSSDIRLVALTNITRWQGLDRLIVGLGRYYNNPRDRVVHLEIVGSGDEEGNLRSLVGKLRLWDYVGFHGAASSEELNSLIDQFDLGIGSLGRHRVMHQPLSTLKAMEYCARGLPFIYSNDELAEHLFRHLCLKLEAGEEPVDIEAIVKYFEGLDIDHVSRALRSIAEGHFSWDSQTRIITSSYHLGVRHTSTAAPVPSA